MPHLEFVMRGIKRVQSQSPVEGRVRLPITPVVMRMMKKVWAPTASLRDTKMLWAACCLAFFWFPAGRRVDVSRRCELRPERSPQLRRYSSG